MYAQLDLEVICKKSKIEGRPPNFHEIWSKESLVQKKQNKTL
jgi:hypothetical protein